MKLSVHIIRGKEYRVRRPDGLTDAEYAECMSRHFGANWKVADGDKRTLYVHRPLLNADEVIAWAKQVGFEKTIVPADMHVTVAFSKKELSWDAIAPRLDQVGIPPSKTGRSVERLGDEGDAVVLRFASAVLTEQWQSFIDAGASWDWPGYKPHVTLSFDSPGIDVDSVTPFDGKLVFGPEVFAELDEDWKDNVAES